MTYHPNVRCHLFGIWPSTLWWKFLEGTLHEWAKGDHNTCAFARASHSFIIKFSSGSAALVPGKPHVQCVLTGCICQVIHLLLRFKQPKWFRVAWIADCFCSLLRNKPWSHTGGIMSIVTVLTKSKNPRSMYRMRQRKENNVERVKRGNRCWKCGRVDKSDGVTPLYLADLYQCWSHRAAGQAGTRMHTHAVWYRQTPQGRKEEI